MQANHAHVLSYLLSSCHNQPLSTYSSLSCVGLGTFDATEALQGWMLNI